MSNVIFAVEYEDGSVNSVTVPYDIHHHPIFMGVDLLSVDDQKYIFDRNMFAPDDRYNAYDSLDEFEDNMNLPYYVYLLRCHNTDTPYWSIMTIRDNGFKSLADYLHDQDINFLDMHPADEEMEVI